MRKDERIVRYTAEELDEMLRRGEDQTNFARIDAMTEEELEAAIDTDEEGEPDWSTLQRGIPRPKREVTVLLDRDLVAWFEAQGAGYQARMNAILRSYIEANRRRDGVLEGDAARKGPLVG